LQGLTRRGGSHQAEGQQQLQSNDTWFGLAKRQLLGIVVYWGVIGADGIDGAIGQGGPEGGTVSVTSKGRVHPQVAVVVTDVDIDHVEMVNGHVSGNWRALSLGLTHQVYTSC